MKRVFFLAAMIFSLSTYAANQEAKMDPKMMEMMKKYEAAGTPGEQHKVLKETVGSWKTTSQMWHSANAKPETTQGTAHFKMVLDGRWLQQDFSGKAMGKPFKGMGFLGYDNVKGKYVSYWFDSMSTGPMEAEGDYDAATKTLKDKGVMSSPVSPTKTEEMRSEWQMVSKNKMIFSMYGRQPAGGPEFKMMEVVYTK